MTWQVAAADSAVLSKQSPQGLSTGELLQGSSAVVAWRQGRRGDSRQHTGKSTKGKST